MAHAMPHVLEISQEMRQCISDCQECHNVCMETVMHCLQMGGRHAEPQHIRLLMDCAEICQTSANYMLRNSPLHHMTCGACAQVCEQCATDCERFQDDEKMLACARVCRTCAESCHKMASHG